MDVSPKKRILFVDDEPNILQALQRMLRKHRSKWDMEFASSGTEALSKLGNHHFDAVVSDMRMPGMDGAELLGEVKRRHPGTVRFVLSGHSEKELVMRSVNLSHRYLAKPCEPESLEEQLESAFACNQLLESESLRSLLADIESIPTLPSTYKKLQQLMHNPDTDAAEIGSIIAQDPPMTAKILQLVNSSYFTLCSSTSDPTEAVTRLGLEVVKGLVLREGVFSQVDLKSSKNFNLQQLRDSGVKTATLARKISVSLGSDKETVQAAFLAGLLHNIGAIVLASNLPAEYLATLELAAQKNCPLWQAEQEVLGTTHAEIGAYVLNLWGISLDVILAIAYQYQPGKLQHDHFEPLTAVHVASGLMPTYCQDVATQMPIHIDIDYLARLGLQEQLCSWEGLAINTAGRST